MSLTGTSLIGAGYSFPRVSGDEPALAQAATPALAFSPRERG